MQSIAGYTQSRDRHKIVWKRVRILGSHFEYASLFSVGVIGTDFSQRDDVSDLKLPTSKHTYSLLTVLNMQFNTVSQKCAPRGEYNITEHKSETHI